MTLASLVIPSRGGARRLPKLLAALAAQDDPEWEAIVVVDGDVDGSEQVLERYSHLPVRVIVFPENRGRVAALNAGFAAARGDVLIRCDDDMVPGPDYVRHVKQAVASGRAAIGLPLNVLPETNYTRIYGSDVDDRFRREAYAIQDDHTWRYWGGNCAVDRATWDEVGGYDPDYRAYGWEDVDYGYRIHASGRGIVLVPQLETPHHAAAVTTRIRVERAYHSGAARNLFIAKHPEAEVSPTLPPPTSLWNRAVRLVGRLSRSTLLRLAVVVDVVIAVVPRAVGRKLVALLVEGAIIAGGNRPTDVTTDL